MTPPPLGNGRMLPYDSVIFLFKRYITLCYFILSLLGHCDETREETHLEWSWQLGCQD